MKIFGEHKRHSRALDLIGLPEICSSCGIYMTSETVKLSCPPWKIKIDISKKESWGNGMRLKYGFAPLSDEYEDRLREEYHLPPRQREDKEDNWIDWGFAFEDIRIGERVQVNFVNGLIRRAR